MKATVCRIFASGAARSWTPWTRSAGLPVLTSRGDTADAPTATDRSPDRRAVRATDRSARVGAPLHIERGRYRHDPAVSRRSQSPRLRADALLSPLSWAAPAHQ